MNETTQIIVFNLIIKVMKRVVKINLVLISLLLVTGGMIYAQGRGRVSDPGQYCANLPGITDQQRVELKALAEKHRAEMDALRSQRQGTTDRETWYAAGQKMREATDKHRFDILSVLTPEQRQVYAPGTRGNPGPAGRGGRGAAMVPGRMAPGYGGRAGMMAPGRGGRGWKW